MSPLEFMQRNFERQLCGSQIRECYVGSGSQFAVHCPNWPSQQRTLGTSRAAPSVPGFEQFDPHGLEVANVGRAGRQRATFDSGAAVCSASTRSGGWRANWACASERPCPKGTRARDLTRRPAVTTPSPNASKPATSAAPNLATALIVPGTKGSAAAAKSGQVVAQAGDNIGTRPAPEPAIPTPTRPVAPTTR